MSVALSVNPIIRLDFLAIAQKYAPAYDWGMYRVVELEGDNLARFTIKGSTNPNMGWDHVETVTGKAGLAFAQDYIAFIRKYAGFSNKTLIRSAKITWEPDSAVVCGLTVYLLNDPAEKVSEADPTDQYHEPVQDRMEEDAEQAQMKAGHA